MSQRSPERIDGCIRGGHGEVHRPLRLRHAREVVAPIWPTVLVIVLCLGLLASACGRNPNPPAALSRHSTLPPAVTASGPPKPPERRWQKLGEDGIRDPASPALALLQQPAEALAVLPPDTGGNQVNWVAALREGHINPRTNVFPETKIRILDLDILMTRTGSLNAVRFPHRPHTEWLDCENCHDRIFARRVGATRVTMYAILQGEYCGQCHGAVSFPLTHCARCHSVPPGEVERLRATLPTR